MKSYRDFFRRVSIKTKEKQTQKYFIQLKFRICPRQKNSNPVTSAKFGKPTAKAILPKPHELGGEIFFRVDRHLIFKREKNCGYEILEKAYLPTPKKF